MRKMDGEPGPAGGGPSAFTEAELRYLGGERLLGRLVTVGPTAPRTSPRWGGPSTLRPGSSRSAGGT
jgi:hypothetical protein